MINCPNCGAPINPYSYKCEYCGTYVFDTCSWDLDNNKPCYVRFKMGNKIITALARPRMETVDINCEPIYVTDYFGSPIKSLHSNRTYDINVRFECIEDKKTKTLFKIQT